jgi:hypothetical protein
LETNSPPPEIIPYSFRSFDRQWIFADGRLLDRASPDLWYAGSDQQIYLTSLLTDVLGEGPSAIATNLLPDLHHFRGSFGGAHVIPLWRNRSATSANVVKGLLTKLSEAYGQPVAPEAFFAYAYAVLFTPQYVQRFWDELTIPGPRLPITKDVDVFVRGVELGQRLLYLHTYGERFAPAGSKKGKVPAGKARCKTGTPAAPEQYPNAYSYDAGAQELHVGSGVFNHVRPEVWEFSVSGLEVLKSWLGYRMKERSGRKSSPLDEIRPEKWTFDNELLDLLWVLDGTIDLLPEVNRLLDEVLQSDLFAADEFPEPTKVERDRSPEFTLFDFGNLTVEEDQSD